MENKVVIVTGSTSGIGKATVIQFASLGCKVVVTGRNKISVANVAVECKNISPKQLE
ncbi:L-xylulose reductase-like protein, partial [Leptotrombidium deliense]